MDELSNDTTLLDNDEREMEVEEGEEEEEEDEDDDEVGDENLDDEDETSKGSRIDNGGKKNKAGGNLQDKLVASGPAGVAAAAAIASVRKRKKPHTFETNPSVRKRQQTRLIRKLRACIDEYTARVGQQAVVLIVTPGKAGNSFKVFGAQPLESVVRSCKHEIINELEQAVLEQTPITVAKDNSGKHELPPLVIDGIPTPVEKMTQAQLRAFIPLMLKFSTGRGKPGWGKESTRPPWWPTTLPWANVRSDARDEDEKQRISWTTTLREIVTNCYKYHGREDLLPIFDEEEEETEGGQGESNGNSASNKATPPGDGEDSNEILLVEPAARQPSGILRSQRPLGSASTRLRSQQQKQQQHLIDHSNTAIYYTSSSGAAQQPGYVTSGAAPAGQFMQTIQNADGSLSLIQVDPANAQILTLPDGTQVRAVRLQTCLGTASGGGGDEQLIGGAELQTIDSVQLQESQQQHLIQTGQQAEVGPDNQIILTSEDGTQSCYPMSQLVSIPASVYQQFAASGQPLQIVTADGTSLSAANAIQIHTLQETQEISQAEATADNGGATDQVQQVSAGDNQSTTPIGKDDGSSLDELSLSAGVKEEPSSQELKTTEQGTNNKAAQRNQRHSKSDGAQSALNGDGELFSST